MFLKFKFKAYASEVFVTIQFLGVILAGDGLKSPSKLTMDIRPFQRVPNTLCPRIKFDLQIFHIFAKFDLAWSNFKFEIWPLMANFALRGQISNFIFDLQIWPSQDRMGARGLPLSKMTSLPRVAGDAPQKENHSKGKI